MLVWLKNGCASEGEQTRAAGRYDQSFADEVKVKVWEELSKWIEGLGDTFKKGSKRSEGVEKDMVVIVGPGAGYEMKVPRTDKDTVMRYLVHSKCAALIEDAYERYGT